VPPINRDDGRERGGVLRPAELKAPADEAQLRVWEDVVLEPRRVRAGWEQADYGDLEIVRFRVRLLDPLADDTAFIGRITPYGPARVDFPRLRKAVISFGVEASALTILRGGAYIQVKVELGV
jgi:hypothetical protein